MFIKLKSKVKHDGTEFEAGRTIEIDDVQAQLLVDSNVAEKAQAPRAEAAKAERPQVEKAKTVEPKVEEAKVEGPVEETVQDETPKVEEKPAQAKANSGNKTNKR